MKRAVTIFFFLIPVFASAQKDPEATKILDGFSKNALEAKAVYMKFSLIVHDKVEQTTKESEGEVVIENNKYKLVLPDNIIWYDGSATWTLAPEVKEVTVTLPDVEDNSFLTSPSSLFSLYRENFKYRMIEDNDEVSHIYLYPEDPVETDLSIIKLAVHNKTYSLVSAEYKRKDGIDLLINISEYRLDKTFDPDFFRFNASDYPDVDIIDMR